MAKRFDFLALWRTPFGMLMVMTVAMNVAFSVWRALINNFAVERAGFTGAEIGLLQSFREVPGFLAFTTVFFLLIFYEQRFAIISLIVLGLGTMATGFWPNELGLYVTTIVMSVGFHYFETAKQSLTLQWLGKDKAALQLGQLIAVGSFASIASFGLIYLFFEVFDTGYIGTYLIGGGVTVALSVFMWVAYPHFKEPVAQNKKLLLRSRYWLYYALTFMGGARRQVFTVFASFLMVEKFGYSVAAITALYLVNNVFNMFFAAKIGALIGKWGERRALVVEYVGLVVVFASYAMVETPWIAAALYLVDHAFFAMAIAMKTYFQKIADPADIAPTTGVAFSINHIAAVGIPAPFGLIWLWSPALVFWLAAGMAAISLGLALLVPANPRPGVEVAWRRRAVAPAE
ncbi:MAG: MFS transporter [Alphaproteobacteria bacterium]